MSRCIWVHAGAYGEFINLLPLLDALHTRDSKLNFVLSTNFWDLLNQNLNAYRSYLQPTPVHLARLSYFQLRRLFKNPPILWLSYTSVVEVKLLRMCSLYQVPVICLYEGFFCTSIPNFAQKRLKPLWNTTTAITTSKRKMDELVQLGIPPTQIKSLKSVKWTR
ncbi:MAG: hypothetical protein I8H75_01150 [Myxococcaceae bacterium]|nr:hypothetical protein [Myxococcaceae bacterium]MBH2005948.1 hypothetical protein [Myxococcaceae bacterium]